MTTLTALLAQHLTITPGSTAGTCYICGQQTEAGRAGKPSENFTAWASCVAGSVICPACDACLHERAVRGASWLVTPESFRVMRKEDKAFIWDAILDPPHSDYGIYLTRGRQKQGWIVAARSACRSRHRIVVATDWVDAPVTINASFRDEVAPLLLRLRSHAYPKVALIAGEVDIGWQVKAARDGWADDLSAVRRYAGDPRWEVLAYAVP